MEIGSLDSYKIKKCCAELIFDATAGQNETALIYMRIGNIFYFGEQEYTDVSAPKIYSQYTHNLGEV
jgi:hypothetical protein